MEEPSDEASSLMSNEKSMDSILSRLGFGPYQKYTFYIAGIGQVADAIEMTVITVLTPVLEDEWDLSVIQMGLLGGVIFLGMIAGNGIAAYYGDSVGRLKMLQDSTLLMFIAAFLSAFMPEYWSFLFMRFFVGMAVGIMIPNGASYAAEICPKEFRGKFIVGFNICFIAGQVLVILLALALLSSLGEGSWRYLLLIAALPVGASYVMLMFVVRESPRFLTQRRRYAEAIDALNFIAEMNQQPSLTSNEEHAITSFQTEETIPGFRKVKVLFRPELRRRTYQLMGLWFSAVFSFYGLIYILPETLGADGRVEMYMIMLLGALIEVPATGLNIYMIDNEKFGRKTTIILSLIGETICFIASVILFSTVGFLVSVTFANFFITIWFSTLYPYTGELYHTSIRTLAYGSLNVVARFGGALAPITLLSLNAVGGSLPYVLLALVSFAATIDAILLRSETRNAALDQPDSHT
jgi:MFS family permease